MSYKLPIALIALAVALPAWAAQQEEVIELKDGTTLYIQADGKMRHKDQQGRVVVMHEGKVMEAKDGSRYMMKNNAVWKQLYEKGTLNPKQ